MPLEFEKALRMLEKRRGDLAGTDVKSGPRNSSTHGGIEEGSDGTLSRWRTIARGWDKILPVILRATNRSEVTQAAVLRFIQTGVHYSSDTPEWCTPTEPVAKAVEVLGSIDLDPWAILSAHTCRIPAYPSGCVVFGGHGGVWGLGRSGLREECSPSRATIPLDRSCGAVYLAPR